MGILEIHFHDSEFRWTINPGTDDERSFSLGSGGESESSDRARRGRRSRSSSGSKLRSVAVLALVVGAGVAFDRLQSRRDARTEGEPEESRRLLARVFS